MKLQEVFDRYTEALVTIGAHQKAIRAESDRELQDLVKQDKIRAEIGRPSDRPVALQSHSFRIATNGTHFFYGFEQQTIQEQIDALVSRTNRQYQWLLAEAYEAFEDFLELAYAAIALIDKSIWPLKDFGNLTLAELDKAPFDSLLALARLKKDKPQSLLRPLRTKLPTLKSFETKNALKVDLWFAVNLIEKLRHHIVHTRGLVSSKKDFTDQILKKCGFHINSAPKPEYTEWIDQYVQSRGNAFFVRLLDIPVESGGLGHFYESTFDGLADCLPAYAHLIASSFGKLESKKNEGRFSRGSWAP